jgi:hypothetical protein
MFCAARTVLEAFGRSTKFEPWTGVPIPALKSPTGGCTTLKSQHHKVARRCTSTRNYHQVPSNFAPTTTPRILQSMLELSTSTLVLWCDAYHRHQLPPRKWGTSPNVGAGRMSKGWDVGRHPAAAHNNRMGKETNDRRDAFWEPIGLGRRALRSKRRVPP